MWPPPEQRRFTAGKCDACSGDVYRSIGEREGLRTRTSSGIIYNVGLGNNTSKTNIPQMLMLMLGAPIHTKSCSRRRKSMEHIPRTEFEHTHSMQSRSTLGDRNYLSVGQCMLPYLAYVCSAMAHLCLHNWEIYTRIAHTHIHSQAWINNEPQTSLEHHPPTHQHKNTSLGCAPKASEPCEHTN